MNLTEPGRSAGEIAEAAAAGEITALWLLHCDPARDSADRELWVKALRKASLVIAHASTLSPELEAHANVVFPAEAGAEREGTITHPDGRVQRVRKAIGSPAGVKPAGVVIARVAEVASGIDLGPAYGPAATDAVAQAVPFYADLGVDEIGGRGVRWQDRDAAANLERGNIPDAPQGPQPAQSPNGALLLGRYRSIWASPEVESSPALKFLARRPTAELSPEDAGRLGLRHGQTVKIGEGHLAATVTLRSDVPEGSVFVELGLDDGANLPAEGSLVEVTGG